MDLTFNLQTPDGKSAEALAAVIDARRKELGETTMQSCVAMAEGILRSLRAQTRTANEKQMELKVQQSDGKYYPSFKREKGSKGKNVSKRILRSGKNGAEVNPDHVVWLLGKYVKGEVAHSYEIEDVVSDEKTFKYIVVAHTQKDATDYAKERHKRRVKQYKGLAKLAISMAMKQVYDRANAQDDSVTDLARKTAESNVEVQVNDTGFNSGTASVYVHDNLNYAMPAMKEGDSSVAEAVNAAIRKAMGYIVKKLENTNGEFGKSLKTTVDELIGAQK